VLDSHEKLLKKAKHQVKKEQMIKRLRRTGSGSEGY
jgi:hypothetical protein